MYRGHACPFSHKESIPSSFHIHQHKCTECIRNLRVVGTNNRADPAKICCHKTNLGNYFDDPTLPTGRLRCTCVYIAARRLDYCTQKAVLSQRAAKCGLHNSGKLSPCSPELDFNLFCDILGEWLDHNRTFFCEIRAKNSDIIRCKHVKTAKRVLLFVLRGKAFCYWIPLVILAL